MGTAPLTEEQLEARGMLAAVWRVRGRYRPAGLLLAMTLVAFMFHGIWLDKRLGSSAWFVLICVFVGAGAGFYSIYRKLMGSAKRDGGGTGRVGSGGRGGSAQ
jgi:F0F1-type ATP synthase assembly protein I